MSRNTTRKPGPTRPRQLQPCLSSELRVPKKQTNGGNSDRGAPKKGDTAKYCKWCKVAKGPFTIHDSSECRRFEKDVSPKDRLVKPFDSLKKP